MLRVDVAQAGYDAPSHCRSKQINKQKNILLVPAEGAGTIAMSSSLTWHLFRLIFSFFLKM